uniref:Kinesin motor domain-containing protein n=1 Tax=Echeneis naucrates TaxID=173247 RepID=A0A665TAC1_ECHNA
MKAHSGEAVVFVRIRPTDNFASGLIECPPDGKESKRGQPSSWSFRLEGVLQDVSQEDVYTRVCARVVQGALNGYNGTFFCLYRTNN